MSGLLSYLFVLAPVAAIAWVVWAYRKRRGDEAARSQERLATMMGLAQAPGAAPGARQEAAATGAPVLPRRAGAWARRERFLTQPETLLYYVLKAGLPGHEIFAHVSLASLVQAAGGATAAELERRVAGHDLDFVVCDKSLRVLAAIRLDRPAQAEPLIVRQCLNAAGIRLVSVRADALPRREQIRPLVYGEAA